MVNLALIGVGSWGKNYIATCQNISDIRIKYLCATSTKNLDTYNGDHIKITDYKKLLLYPDIDGVIIATPNATHDEITQEFLKKGIPVLVEKPMSENYQKSKLLHTIKPKSTKIFQVGFVYLFDPAYIKTKKLVENIGKIRYIDYEGTSYGLLRKNSSALWDIGSHALSLCLDVSNSIPNTISAWASNVLYPHTTFYDAVFIKITFLDGTSAYIKLNWLFPQKRRNLLIAGQNDSILYDAEAEKKITYFQNMIPKNKDIYQRYNGAKITYPSYAAISPLENELKEFVHAITMKKEVTYSGVSLGLQVTKLLSLAERSIAHYGKPILCEA